MFLGSPGDTIRLQPLPAQFKTPPPKKPQFLIAVTWQAMCPAPTYCLIKLQQTLFTDYTHSSPLG